MRKDWEVSKIGKVCVVIPGQSPKSKFYNTDRDGMPFYQGKKRFTNRFIDSPIKWTTNVTKIAERDDILMSVRAPVGPVNFATEKICIGRGLTAIRAQDSVDKDFLFYFLQKNEADLDSTKGAVFDSINSKQIKNIKIPIPPLPEQKRIVDILDEAFEAIDQAKANIERNIQNAEELFQSKLNEILSGVGMREEWEKKKIGEVMTVQRGGSPRPIKKYLTDSPDGLNWIKISDATASNKYIYETKQKITKDGLHKTRMVEEGDFLLSNSMSFGRPYIMKTKGCIHDGWLVLKDNKLAKIDKSFLYYLLGSSTVFQQFDSLAAGSTVRNLNINLVSSVKIPIPPLSEQKRIVVVLDNIKEQQVGLLTTYNRKLQNLEELKKSLLQKAFSGELTKNEEIAA